MPRTAVSISRKRTGSFLDGVEEEDTLPAPASVLDEAVALATAQPIGVNLERLCNDIFPAMLRSLDCAAYRVRARARARLLSSLFLKGVL